MTTTDVHLASEAADTEREDLLAFLEAQRRSVLAILAGLDEDSVRRSLVPSGWTPLGLIEHLGYAERFWFQQVLTGRADPLPWPPGRDDDAGPLVTGHPLNEVLSFYRNQCARSDAALTSTSLAARPAGEVPPDMADEVCNARAIVLHMIEETARHAGHLDIVRELIDGRTGLGPR